MTNSFWGHYNSKFSTIYYSFSIIIKYYKMRMLVVTVNSFESFGNIFIRKDLSIVLVKDYLLLSMEYGNVIRLMPYKSLFFSND